jgi:hypothetical protein
LTKFKSLLVPFTFPKISSEKGKASNSHVENGDYKRYTADKVPSDISDQLENSNDLIAGFKGEVLKSDKNVREGKGLQ